MRDLIEKRNTPIDLIKLGRVIYNVHVKKGNYAHILKWSQGKMSRMTIGLTIPRLDDAIKMGEKLKLTREEFNEIFLPDYKG